MKSSLAAIFFSLLGLSLSSMASQASKDTITVGQIRQNIQICLEKAGLNMMERSLCFADGETAADNELNRVYQAAIKSLQQSIVNDPGSAYYARETLKRLRASEVQWIRFRDAQALLEAADGFGGNEEAALISQSHIQQTLERINLLTKLENL